MNISELNKIAGYPSTATSGTAKSAMNTPVKGDTTTKEQGVDAPKREDQFVSSSKGESVTYQKPSKIDHKQLMELEQKRSDSFTEMLRSMVVKQGQKSNLTLMGMDLFVTPEQSAKAAKEIEPGGEYSVDAVAGRILDMAKALSGNDESKIELLRTAAEKGFQAAGVDFGEKMPEITKKTYDKVMQGFDDWKKSFESATGTESTKTDKLS